MTPPSTNVLLRNHWAVRKRLIDEWHTAVWALANEVRLPPQNVVTVEATIYFRDKRKRDKQNYITSVDKLVLDGLVRCGILPDDDPEHVKSFAVGFEVDSQKPRTEITIYNRS